MSNHKDRTPLATQGRLFPFSISEIRKIIRDNNFKTFQVSNRDTN
jgi:hypothetical protein